MNQNNFWDELSIRYTSDGVMFRTVIEQMVVAGKFDSSVKTSRMALMVVQSLTLTPFFTDPASLVTGAGNGGLREYLTGSALPGKEKASQAAAKNLMDLTTNSALNNSWVAYLKRQGNRYDRR